MVQFSESLTKRIIISLSSPLDKRDDTYIVTPRRRLARQIKEEFNNSMQGKLSYSPQIMTLGDWIIFHGEALLAKEQILLMGSLQAQLIWGEALSRVKKEDILEELTTWDIGREAGATNTADAMRQKLIVQAQDAWRKIHLYQLELNSRVFAKDKITHFFYEWSNAYQEICEQRKLCDEFMLTDKLLAAIATKEVGIKRSLWVGFTDNYPVYERLYELIRKQGGGLIDKVDAFRIKSESEGKVQVPQLMMEEYENDQDELLDLAQKVKLFAQENPESQVGVVIPGLEKNWHKVRQSFAHALLEERDTSNYSAEELLDELDLPFDMSWGEELQEFPLIGSLLDLLRLNQERTSPAELLDRFNSPYLAGHKEEIIARTRLNSKLCLMSVTYRAISLADIAAKSPL
ncbi:MAG: hypothetical protein HAW61_03650, partial [Candidatus Portiera sp.]|nr:hypothetical protein [Portiera sp.]